jgi:hypothetical protein
MAPLSSPSPDTQSSRDGHDHAGDVRGAAGADRERCLAAFSHGLRRVPAPGEFRIHAQYGGRRAGLFRAFPPDFFDLVIVDECHRGSARDESSWRAILQYFEPAFQLGMTATPLRDDNRDTYLYFGNPIYEYGGLPWSRCALPG